MRRHWSTLVAILVLCLGTVAASNAAARSAALSHQMMCTCGCAQILGECNHMGCPNAPGMLDALHTDVAKGMSDRAVLLAFEQEYGAAVLASPMFTVLNRAAWFVPPVTLLLGLLGAILLLRRWRAQGHAAAPAARKMVATSGTARAESELLARVRRETGGF